MKRRRVEKTGLSGLAVVVAAAAILCGGFCTPAQAALKKVWVTTNRTVDCSSLDTILRDVIKPGMTDEQKVVALFNFYRSVVFHHRNTRDSADPIKLFNILGYTLCGTQGATNCALLRKAGFEARVVCWPNGAHTFYEVKYGGRMHVLDTMTNFYVYTRGKDKHIADMAELKADPSLALKAKAEGRACPGFLMCGDSAKAFTRGARTLNRHAVSSSYSPKELSLYKGMEFTRFWDCRDRPCPKAYNPKYVGPLHACGSKDERSAENFHNWAPYLVRNLSNKTKSYRHWGSGRVVYSPALRAGDWSDSTLAADNLASGKNDEEPALHPAKAGTEAVWEFEIRIPYYITEGVLYLTAQRKNTNDVLRAEVSTNGGQKWTKAWEADGTGKQTAHTDLTPLIVKPCPGRFNYRLRFIMQAAKNAADVGLNNIYLRTSFQHNFMSAPALLPGKNKVTVEAAPAKEGEKFPAFEVIYRLQAGKPWERKIVKGGKEIVRHGITWDSSPVTEIKWTVKKSPATFEAELPALPGNLRHRMKSLTYRCGKLAWRPAPTPPVVVDDFTKGEDGLKNWKAGPALKLSRDGKRLVIEAGKGKYPQTMRRNGLKLDASKYKYLLVDFENGGGYWRGLKIGLFFGRKRSDTSWLLYSRERPRIKIPLSYFLKANLHAVTGVYINFPRAPKGGKGTYYLYSIRFLPAEE